MAKTTMTAAQIHGLAVTRLKEIEIRAKEAYDEAVEYQTKKWAAYNNSWKGRWLGKVDPVGRVEASRDHWYGGEIPANKWTFFYRCLLENLRDRVRHLDADAKVTLDLDDAARLTTPLI